MISDQVAYAAVPLFGLENYPNNWGVHRIGADGNTGWAELMVSKARAKREAFWDTADRCFEFCEKKGAC